MRYFKTIAINLIVFLVFMETALVAYHLITTGEFFYGRQKNLAECNGLEVKSSISAIRLHPYFGHVWGASDPDMEAKKDYRMTLPLKNVFLNLW